MGLPENYYVELQAESCQKTLLGTVSKSISKIFQVMGEDRIEITIMKPAQDDSSFMNYLISEIKNAVNRYDVMSQRSSYVLEDRD